MSSKISISIGKQLYNQHLPAIVFFALWVLLSPADVHAYIGPGAGFAFIGSAFALIVAFLTAVITILFWPIRLFIKAIRGKKVSKNAQAKRIIIIGLDGLDPLMCQKYMADGRLPHLSKLARDGFYSVLSTTCLPISPVAWSTFQTGVNPGGHSIFDFLTRDKRTYAPILSSSVIAPPRRTLKLLKWQLPVSKPQIRLLRRSRPFWNVLGENGIFSHVLRVPITFPPEKCYGNVLSAMCTPDLLGSQGTFSLYSSETSSEKRRNGGVQIALKIDGNKVHSYIEGPDDPTSVAKKRLKIPFTLELGDNEQECVLRMNGNKITLKRNHFTDWIRINFRTSLGMSIGGICRFCLRQVRPHIELYVSPINIDPESPAFPIAYPTYYSRYLSKLNGVFGTLGLLEDTWALNEQALDDETFLKQVYLNHVEREKMFFDALDKTRQGLCVCVFDASDRIQHMFWRYLDDEHPARNRNSDACKNAIPEMYGIMDDLVGKVLSRLKKEDLLFILSDHGFKTFRRCVNVNTWLVEHGYMALRDAGITGKDYFADVDWSGTRAFSLGMGGIYLNVQGREARGIVDPNHVPALKREISGKLSEFCDPRDGTKVVRNVYDSGSIYKGPYRQEAPDLIIGWEEGYRASWECVTGKLKPTIFEDNTKAWSGDHCVDVSLVPGVFFSNRKIVSGMPRMEDIAPTVLKVFDVKIPEYMEGRPLEIL